MQRPVLAQAASPFHAAAESPPKLTLVWYKYGINIALVWYLYQISMVLVCNIRVCISKKI